MKLPIASSQGLQKQPAQRGFTLLEIMVVAAVIGVLMAAGVPTLYKALRKEGFRKSVSDIVDVCTAARAKAITEGSPAVVEFRPFDGTCTLVGGGGKSGGLAHSAQIEGGRIEMLDVNLRERKEDEVVHVQFYQNGTSDEMTLILASDENEWRRISLEITTGMATVSANPNEWR